VARPPGQWEQGGKVKVQGGGGSGGGGKGEDRLIEHHMARDEMRCEVRS